MHLQFCVFVLFQMYFYFLIFEKCNSKIGELSSRKIHSGTFHCPEMDLAGTRDISFYSGVTGQSIPPTGLYPGLKRPRLDYTRVYMYYGLGQFISRGILWPRPIHSPSGQNYTPMISITISIVLSDIL